MQRRDFLKALAVGAASLLVPPRILYAGEGWRIDPEPVNGTRIAPMTRVTAPNGEMVTVSLHEMMTRGRTMFPYQAATAHRGREVILAVAKEKLAA